MSKVRLVMVAVIVVAAVSMIPTAADASPLGGSGPGEYVALGDSYAAGEGVDPAFGGGYYDGTDTATNRCHRSNRSYVPQVAELLTSVGAIVEGRWLFPACSGDRTEHLFTRSGNDHSAGAVAQLDHLDVNTKFVTLSIGGNDVGFGDALRSCAESVSLVLAEWIGPAGASASACNNTINSAQALLDSNAVARQLVDVYRAVLERAPNARLVVVTYPRIFPNDANYTGHTVSGRKYCVTGGTAAAGTGYRSSTVNRFNRLHTQLNRSIVDTVKHVRTVDELPGRISVVRLDTDELATHTLHCGDTGNPAPYVNGTRVAFDPDVVSQASFHPNDAGHSAFVPYVAAQLAPAGPFVLRANDPNGMAIDGGTLRIRAGTGAAHQITFDPRNGAPTWGTRNDFASAPDYSLGLERLPTGLPDFTLASTSQRAIATFTAPPVPGTHRIRAVAHDGAGATARKTITVEALTGVAITTTSLPPGDEGTPYAATVEASPLIGPPTWTASGLPTGLTIDAATGTISGTPAAEGTYAVTIGVDDTTATASASFSLRIGPPIGRFYVGGMGFATSLSRDGRWVASTLTRRTNGVESTDVEIRNIRLGTPPVRISQAGSVSGCVTGTPRISSDGRFVTFSSCSRFSPADTNNFQDIYRWDATTGALTFVPGSTTHQAGPISDDGRRLVTIGPDARAYVFDLGTGTSQRADRTPAGILGNGNVPVRGIQMTPDGRHVLFSSSANNLDPADGDTTSDLYLRDLDSGEIRAVTAGLTDGGVRLSAGAGGTITDDLRLLVFSASKNGLGLQVLLDSTTGEVVVIGDNGSDPAISADGSMVAFHRQVYLPATPGIGGSPATSYGAQHRAAVTVGPLGITDVMNLSKYEDGTDPRVYGSLPVVFTIGISATGREIVWYSTLDYSRGTFANAFGTWLHRVPLDA
jgi:lysophospholipase L1-like esterase